MGWEIGEKDVPNKGPEATKVKDTGPERPGKESGERGAGAGGGRKEKVKRTKEKERRRKES